MPPRPDAVTGSLGEGRFVLFFPGELHKPGVAQWQVGQGVAHTVGGEVINGGIEVFMEAPVAVQMFQRIADHDVLSVFVL